MFGDADLPEGASLDDLLASLELDESALFGGYDDYYEEEGDEAAGSTVKLTSVEADSKPIEVVRAEDLEPIRPSGEEDEL